FEWSRARDSSWPLPLETEVGDQVLADGSAQPVQRGHVRGRVGGTNGQLGNLLEWSRQQRPRLRRHALGDELPQATGGRREAERFRVQWQESEWYLGETRATVAHVQEQLTSMRETYGWLEHAYREVEPRLHEAAHERDDANRDLVEARAAHEALLRQHLEMAA